MTYKYLNGKLIELTQEEEQARLQDIENSKSELFSIKLTDLRIKRNSLLVETDYLGLSDQTMSEAMANYRQQLRDITDGLTTIEEVEAVEFPTKP
jgi:hypothetical protein